MPEAKKWFGLVARRDRWGLTWRGRLVAAVMVVAALLGFVLFIHPFLAVTKTVPASVLVVEGWVDISALRTAAKTFNEGGYDILYTTGGPTGMNPNSLSISDTYASVAAHRLRELGVPADRLQMVPCESAERGRTYASAAALRDYLREKQPTVTALNIVTKGPHARRTCLTYERAFGDSVAIGIIASKNADYNPERWWRSSEGLKEVISESAAYLYARLLGSGN